MIMELLYRIHLAWQAESTFNIPATSARLAETDDMVSSGAVVTLCARMGVAWIDVAGAMAGDATCKRAQRCKYGYS
jgi:hypothetical protein